MANFSFSPETQNRIALPFLNFLHHVLKQVKDKSSLSCILQEFVEQAQPHIGESSTISLLVCETAEERFFHAAGVTPPADFLVAVSNLNIPCSGLHPLSELIQEKKLVHISTFNVFGASSERGNGHSITDCWIAPVQGLTDQLLGVLICHFPGLSTLGTKENDIVAILSQTAALAIERYRSLITLETMNVRFSEEIVEHIREKDRIWRNSMDLLLAIDPSGVIRSINPAFTNHLGYEAEDLIGRYFDPFVHPDDVAPTIAAITHALQMPLDHFEMRIRHKSGVFRWFAWRAMSEDGMVYANGRDITPEVQAKNKMAELAEENQALIENSLDIIALFDKEGHVLRINSAVEEITGYAQEEIIGKPYFEFLSPEYVNSTVKADAFGRERKGAFQDFENAWRHKDGSQVYLSWSVRFSDDGSLMYATGRNVTERYRTQAELQKSKQQLNTLLESVGDAFFALDNDWRVTYVNKRTADFLGYRREDLLGQIAWEAVPEFLKSSVFPFYQKAMETRRKTFFEGYWEPRQSWVEVRIYPNEDGLAVFFHDIMDRREAENAIRASEQRLREVIELTPAGYAVVDEQALIRDVNPALCRIAGYEKEELIGKTITQLIPTCPFDSALLVKDGISWAHGREGELLHKDGHRLSILVNANVKRDEDGNTLSLTAFMTDITDRKQAEARLEALATHDSLTGLPNREFLNSRIQKILDTQPYRNSLAVMFLDLDRFKEVNDTMGHDPGDTLLRKVAHRLKSGIRPNDIVARLGGDEFIILANCSQEKKSAQSIAAKLLSLLSDPFDIEGQEIFVSASIGISMFPEHGTSKEELFKHADMAMYGAKAAGRNRYCFYETGMSEAARIRRTLENSLHRSLGRGEFELYYQPRLDLKTMEVTGMEALIRWNHPELGRVPPLDFIPIAEESGAIEAIGSWVLKESCAQAKRLINKLNMPLRISVNLSARQLKSRNLVAQVRSILRNTCLPSHLLELELTETALMDDLEASATVLKELKAIGVSIAVDDFGTGYSGLAYLQRFPLDVLKLDQSFIRENAEEAKNLKFIKAFLDLAHALNLSVVAEGIETQEILQVLQDFSCDEGQGYLFAKPLPIEELERFLIGSPIKLIDKALHLT